MTTSYFRVFHFNNACLGAAKMVNNKVYYKTDVKAYAWFEARTDTWLRDFAKIVRRLCISTGHTSRFSITEDEASGIKVERVTEKSPLL